ncbi:MAG: hypothetical protein HYY06_12195 [Deltaproteobacteria bacterium]|nr:hypothetical protein [Deltaproteobacteria bacterium]
MVTVRRLSLASIAGLCACVAGGALDEGPPPDLDENEFRCAAEPVLLARCAFFACHGSNRRPLRIFAPDKLRTGVSAADRASPLTPEEREVNYDMARGFARTAPDGVPLLDKPLDVEAGGRYHGGKDLYGGADVFETTADPGYALLEGWVRGEKAADDCLPTGAVGP